MNENRRKVSIAKTIFNKFCFFFLCCGKWHFSSVSSFGKQLNLRLRFTELNIAMKRWNCVGNSLSVLRMLNSICGLTTFFLCVWSSHWLLYCSTNNRSRSPLLCVSFRSISFEQKVIGRVNSSHRVVELRTNACLTAQHAHTLVHTLTTSDSTGHLQFPYYLFRAVLSIDRAQPTKKIFHLFPSLTTNSFAAVPLANSTEFRMRFPLFAFLIFHSELLLIYCSQFLSHSCIAH